jgi:hypothetical protein
MGSFDFLAEPMARLIGGEVTALAVNPDVERSATPFADYFRFRVVHGRLNALAAVRTSYGMGNALSASWGNAAVGGLLALGFGFAKGNVGTRIGVLTFPNSEEAAVWFNRRTPRRRLLLGERLAGRGLDALREVEQADFSAQ